MKYAIKITALVLVLGALLCGCSLPEKEFSCNGLTITLNAGFADMSNTDMAEGLDFFYLSPQMGVTGNKLEKALVTDAPNALTAEDFVKLMMQSNSHTGEIICRGEIYSYTYRAVTDGEEFTYLVAVFDAGDCVWILQSYSKTADFNKLEADMWSYLETVTIS